MARKEKRERQAEMEVPVALTELKLTEVRVERLEKVIMGARKLRETVTKAKEKKKAAMAGAESPVSLWLLFYFIVIGFFGL